MPDPKNNITPAKLRALLLEQSVTPKEHAENLSMMALALSASVKRVYFEKSETKFRREPSIVPKLITQFRGLMRIDAMEKFNQTTAFSLVHFYKDNKSMKANVPLGLIIVYVERKYVPEMLRLLKYPYIDDDDDNDVLDGVGAIVNLIGGQLKREFKKLGYIDLEMSPFHSFINKIPEGVLYPKDQIEKYELNFELDETKRLVLEMVMTSLPRARA